MAHFSFYRKSRIMKPIKVLELSEVDRLKLEKGYHNVTLPTHISLSSAIMLHETKWLSSESVAFPYLCAEDRIPASVFH